MHGLRIIGHRGARGLAPENTLAAFQAALDNNADMVEFDARVTSDGIIVLNHDSHVSSLEVRKNTYDKLKAAKPDLITFDEALKLLSGTPLYIEIKPGVDTEPIIERLQKLLADGTPAKNIFVASFSQRILREIHEALPEVGIIVNEIWSGVRAARRARQLDTKIISMNKNALWFGYIKAVSRKYTLYTFTLNNPKKAHRWAKWGLAGVATDYPDRFKKS